MTGPNNEHKRAKETLHELNARVQADPSHKLDVIKAYYAECSGSDVEAADMALIVKDIVEAGGKAVDPVPHIKAATPILIVGMVIGGLMSIVAIVGGAYAIFKNATATTQMNIWGATISTGSAGVAFAFLGVIGLILIIRAAFKRIALPK